VGDSENKLGLPFMVPDPVFKFQMIYLRVIMQEPNMRLQTDECT